MARALYVVVAALLSCACQSESTPVIKPVGVGWRPVAAFSGHGNSQTESFNVDTGQWRIKWDTKNETSPDSGTFRVMVHSAVSGRPMMLAVEHRGAGHDVAYVNEDPRLYHLVIESEDLDWSLKIEEAVVAYGK